MPVEPESFTIAAALAATRANTPEQNTDDAVARFPTEAAEAFGDALDGKVDGTSIHFVVP